MVYLTRRGPRLLRQVGGKQHAGESDHEVRKEEEEDVGREPESSGDEAAVQKVEVKRQEQKVVGAKGKRGGKMRAPGRGVFERGRALKGEGKENIEGDGKEEEEEEEEEIRFGMGSTPKKRGAKTFGKGKVGYGSKSMVGSQGTKRKGEDEGIYWGMGSTPPKKMRTVNVHAAKGGKAFGKKVNPTAQPALPKESDLSHLSALDSALSKDNALSSIIDAHDPYCDLSSDDLPSPSKTPSSFPPLTLDLPPTSPLTSLPDIPSPISPISSPHNDTSPPAACPLCLDPIEANDYTSFYETHTGPRTVRLQMLFCRDHKRKAAEREYVARGWPAIDWVALPGRIRAFNREMISVLRNEGEESAFRTRYKERLASGKGAWMPRRRAKRMKHDEEMKDDEAVAQLDHDAPDVEPNADEEDLSLSTSRLTGYYGPRGKRLMMEVLTLELAAEIRDAAVKDPVVGRSGFALFLQAVVVPELVLRLVEEDFGVGREEARGLVEASWWVGGRVNGEVEEMGEEEREEDEEEGMEDEEVGEGEE